jgi:L-iditol 2-dehydrogenase
MMKIARIYGFQDIRVEEMQEPVPGPGQAVMKTRASGICSGDVMPWYIEKKAPLVLGHEPGGEIVKVGGNVTSVWEGDRVFVHHHAPCMRCRSCRRGDYVQCKTWAKAGIYPGGMAEYVLITQNPLENDTLVLAEDVGYEDATLVEPLACAVKAHKRAGLHPGDTALVIGLGVMGMLNLLLLKLRGAERVIGADMVPFRLERARELGADGVIDVSRENLEEKLRDLNDGELADIVVVGPNSVEALTAGLRSAGPGGTVVMFTPVKPGESLTLDPNELYFQDISLVTSYSCGPSDTREALHIIEKGIVRADMLVTHRFPIEKTAEAYRLTAEARDSLKCLVVFE